MGRRLLAAAIGEAPMMPTEIIRFDVHAAPHSIPVRDDVQAVFVVATAHGRPVGLLPLPRPASGVLSSAEILRLLEGDGVRDEATPPAPAPPVSIVVCTRERPDDLARCLASLAGVEGNGHEVIVVDNAPTTSRTAEVSARFGVRIVTERRVGLNRARNAGVAAATHDLVAFVDDDVVVSPGWVSAIGAPFADPSVGCATGLVLPLELETAAQEQLEVYSMYRRTLQRRLYSRKVLRSSTAAVVGIGANMAYRRDVLHALGGFDVRLDAGTRTRAGGDTDMFARTLDAGHQILYSPDAYVWHRHRRSIAEMRSAVFGYSVGTYSVLTKRIIEQGDFQAIGTAARWLLGPWLTAARGKLSGRPAPQFSVVAADTIGAACGPFLFGLEAWHNRANSEAAA